MRPLRFDSSQTIVPQPHYLCLMQEIIVIGAGNLAWHLVQVLQRQEYDVALASRNPDRVASWPVRVIRLADIPVNPLLVFLAVPDNAIDTVSTELSLQLPPTVPVVHTSGATPITRINEYFQERGALWPIRSLRQGESVPDWNDLPLVYYSDKVALTQVLGELCKKLSNQVFSLDDDQRAQLHLAAVFSNNFVTWMYQISHELCAEQNIPFATLLPIIRNTALKQDGTAPKLTQTGAAARGDTVTMDRHLSLLYEHPDYAQLYRTISQLIEQGVQDQP